MNWHTTDLHDENPGTQVLLPILRSFGGRTAFEGRVATVEVNEDNVRVVEALESEEPGSVLVVDGGGSTNCALVGDRLAGIAVERGLAGIIINGCVRDIAQLATMDMGVLALAPNPRSSGKLGHGARNVSVSFGGVRFDVGGHVYADEDGVIVAPRPLV